MISAAHMSSGLCSPPPKKKEVQSGIYFLTYFVLKFFCIEQYDIDVC